MLKWPGLHYSTSAFAPKHYPKDIIDYANTRGSDKIIYAGYFPMGMHIDRIMTDMPSVPFKDEVWPKFLHESQKVEDQLVTRILQEPLPDQRKPLARRAAEHDVNLPSP